MVSRTLFGVALAAVGVLLLLVGLLFLVAAGGQTHRYAVAAVGVVLGGVLLGVGVRLVKDARARLPEALAAELLALARAHSGRITAADVAAALGGRAALGLGELDRLCARGVATRQRAEGTEWFVFEDLLPRLAVRRCRHCRTELPLAETLTNCPNCGGELRTGVERLEVGDQDLYRMD